MLISPLARKLCQKKGIDPATLRGSGPRGRIMAADVASPSSAAPHARRGETAITDFATPPTRPEKDGYYVYDNLVNMSALARISLPIAVQCEKLLEQRYSLLDYIVRAVVKACTTYPDWMPENGVINVLRVEDNGNKLIALQDAARKRIYRLSKETQRSTGELPQSFYAHIAVCDTDVSRAQVAELIGSSELPLFGFATRGHSPKTDIRAGSEATRSTDLPYTFYVSTTLPQQEANRIAARLSAFLYNPISLLMLS